MGIDLKGGVLAVFDCKAHEDGEQPSLDEIKATETRLLNSLNRAGLTEATVQHQGNSGNYKIRVEVPGLNETEEVFSAVGNPAKLDFRLKKAEEGGEPIVDGAKKHIAKVELYQDPKTFEFGVLLTLSKEGNPSGADLFKQMIQDANQYTYIYRNDELFSTVSVGDKSAGRDGTAVITLGRRANGAMPSRQDAEEFKMQIESGLFEVRLVNAETSIIPQTLGDGALMGCIIALVLGIIFMFIYMWIRYGDLGLLSNLSIGVFMVLFLFALAIVNAVQLTLPGIAGIVIAFAMAVDANIIIFERIKDEYQTGKRLAVSAKGGFDKSLWTIFDSNITTIIGAAVLFFLGTGPIKGFAITLMLGVIISMFCCLCVTRAFVKLYLVLNSNNAKRVKMEETNPYVKELPTTATPAKPKERKLNLGGVK